MKKRLVLIAAIIIIAGCVIYKSYPNNHLMDEKSITNQESMPVGQQLEIKSDKIVYQLEKRQYDETVYDDVLMERVLTYIENYPEDSDVVPNIEGELRREWLKQTAIFRIEILNDNEIILINDYLKQQGISKTIPDSTTYYNGYPFIRYYEDDKSGKVAFVASVSYDAYDSSSIKEIYCGVAHTEDLKKEGSFIYDFEQGGKLLSETFYNNQGEQVTDISYTYNMIRATKG